MYMKIYQSHNIQLYMTFRLSFLNLHAILEMSKTIKKYFDEIGQNYPFRTLIIHFVLPDLHMPTEIQCNCFFVSFYHTAIKSACLYK